MTLRETLATVASTPAQQWSQATLHTLVKQAEAELRIVDARLEAAGPIVADALAESMLRHGLQIETGLCKCGERLSDSGIATFAHHMATAFEAGR